MKKIRLMGVPILSLAVFLLAVYGLVGFIIAVPVALGVGVEAGKEASNILTTLTFGIVSGGAVLILTPLAYAVLGFINGLIVGIILNIFLKFAGGLELEISER